jgi:copper transport protein
LWLVVAGSILAHADLTHAEPAPGAQLVESPAEIRLTFSEPLAPDSRIVLLAEGFQPIGGIATETDPAQPEVLFAPLPALEPGAYTVQWTAASADGHAISGSYSFSFGSTSEAEDGSLSRIAANWPWLLTLIALLIGLLLALSARRRGNRA